MTVEKFWCYRRLCSGYPGTEADVYGWVLSPAYDLNPTPMDLKPRILSTNISLDEGTCFIDLALSQAELFGLSLVSARKIVAEVGQAVATWREVSKALGLNRSEIERMESAFEHGDSAMASRMSS